MNVANRFKNLPPYIPIEPFDVLSERLGRLPQEIVKLDANENPYGPSPKVRNALADLQYPHIYPDPESRALRDKIANYINLPADKILAGAGADELIDLILRVVLEPDDIVLNFPPTFGMYPFDTHINAGRLIEIRRKDDFSLNMDEIIEALKEYKPKVMFITSPNNPDGSLIQKNDLQKLLQFPVLVVLDEAYIEFCENGGLLGETKSSIVDVPLNQNLVVLRTFSKWAGLAGLRVGYGAFPDWLSSVMWKAKQPYNVSVAASAAGIASLEDIDYLTGNIRLIIEERKRLYELLGTVPYLKPFPSQANFILCKVNGYPALDIKNYLQSKGILVRYYNNPLLEDYIRISIGKPDDTDIVIKALLSYDEDKTEFQTPSVSRGFSSQKVIITGPRIRKSRTIRITKETEVVVDLDIDGQGIHQINTGLPFLDHMLVQVTTHGLFNLTLDAKGDLEIDPHHTTEDIGLVLGQAFRDAAGDRRGIKRMATIECPMDESLASVTVDFSGRPHTVFHAPWQGSEVGHIPVSLIQHFFESFANEARCNLHIRVLYGQDNHHQAEAIFKAFGRALDESLRVDQRRLDQIPSSKGSLL